MRLYRAIGLTAMVLALAAAAVTWAPAVAAQPGAGAQQERHNVVVTVDAPGGEQPQGATWIGQAGNVFAMGGPRLGVSIRDVEAADVTKMKLAAQAGVVVEDVTKDSAAARAGLKPGDVIVQIDGEAVRSTRQFARLISESAPGRAVKIGVIRDGKRTDVEATLTNAEGPLVDVIVNRDRIRREVERGMAQAERGMAQGEPLIRQFRMERQPGQPGGTGTPGRPGTLAPRLPSEGVFTFEGPFGEALASRGRFGVTVQELTPELAAYFGVKDGVLVSTVRADSPAAKAGIKAGDVITAVNDKPIPDANTLVAQVRDKEGDVTIGLSRDKKAMSVKATFEKLTPSTPSKPKVVVRGKPV